MRPALAALQEQQQVLAGLQTTANQVTAQHRIAFSQLRQAHAVQGQELAALREQNRKLAVGLRAIARMAGVESQVADAMFRTADVQNPAQPVPEPAPEAATTTTQEAETPEAMANVQTPGLVGGSTQDVAADATSTVYTPGEDVDAPALKQLVDVTAPVDGAQNPRPLSEVRTETDVRVGNPMNPQVGFPLEGPFQQGQSLRGAASKNDGGSNRFVASLHLARLRIATGTAEGDDIAVATTIQADASLSNEAIEREIETLGSVQKAAARKHPKAQPQARGLVPRTAGVARTVPSMQGSSVPHTSTVVAPSYTAAEIQDADLFG